MISRLLIVSAVLIAYLGLAGCATLSQKESTQAKEAATLEPSSINKFSDIPVPVGFRLLADNSYSFESTGVRVGVLRYQGKARPEQVISFYKDQMPMYNWNFLNVIEYGDRLINFDRETETCIITLLHKGDTLTITISVGPKAQPQKKAAKPAK